MSREPQASARRVQGAENKQRALELRKAGATYEQIGQQLGMTRQSAHKAVKTALESIAKESSEEAAEVLVLELERLDQMLTGLWVSARQGNVASVDRVLRIMERRSRLLGLDADSTTRLEGTTIQVQVAWPVADPKAQPDPLIVDGDSFTGVGS